MNSTQWDYSSSDYMFKPKTNLPSSLHLQPGARVNSLISYGICNGTMLMNDVDPFEEYARIAFSVRGSIIDIDIYITLKLMEIIVAIVNFPCRTASSLRSQNPRPHLTKSMLSIR
jgi:hypothetical protein